MSKSTLKYFSGYIRNYESLCGELDIEPNKKRADREREILEKGFDKWGEDICAHLYGAFVFAVESGGKTYIFRDQVGQKHMFYAEAQGELLYSGDINEIANDSRFTKKLNQRMLQHYLFYGYPIGEETFYEGAYKLLPGHYIVWDGEKLEKHRYWKPVFEPDRSKSEDDWAREIEDVVEEIFREERADSEVPYKESFLSGGVDSSYLLAAGDAQAANTVGYAEDGFDESDLARNTAEILGKEFRVKMIAPDEFFERIPTVMEKMGQPLGDASAVAFSLGCQAVKEHTDVVYSGEGIDEFFGGYNAHKRHIPDSWTYLTCSRIMSEDVVKALVKDFDESVNPAEPVEALWKSTEGMDELDRKLTVDISLWLEGDIYLNTDRTSTACGIELHTPFSDLRLFNTARKIPQEMKFRNEQNKYAFRKAASSKLPYEVAFRKKVGFPVPVRSWMAQEPYSGKLAETLFGENAKKLFNINALKEMWDSFIGGEAALWNRIYAIYAFLVWYEINF